MVCNLVLVLCLSLVDVDEGGGVGIKLLVLSTATAFFGLFLSLSLFLLPLILGLLVGAMGPTPVFPATTPAPWAWKWAKLGELGFVPGALGTGVGVILGTADLRVVIVGALGVVPTAGVSCFRVCF